MPRIRPIAPRTPPASTCPRQVLIPDVLLGWEEVPRSEPPSEALEARRHPVGFPSLVIVEGEKATHELEVVGGGARQILLVDVLGNALGLHRQRIPH